jgi:hypothetical protein
MFRTRAAALGLTNHPISPVFDRSTSLPRFIIPTPSLKTDHASPSTPSSTGRSTSSVAPKIRSKLWGQVLMSARRSAGPEGKSATLRIAADFRDKYSTNWRKSPANSLKDEANGCGGLFEILSLPLNAGKRLLNRRGGRFIDY